jgi:vitamin K-dependent gamma-carboxylase
VQVLLPLRHFLYPGNVSWTEEGHRFSWHMKLRSKAGDAVFLVRDPQSGKEWTVDPDKRLDPWQARMLPKHPDMILQYSHHLAEHSRRKGIPNVEVRAKVSVSLNGRKRQRLIDSRTDLAKVNRRLRPSSWILPLTTPLEEQRTSDQARR